MDRLNVIEYLLAGGSVRNFLLLQQLALKTHLQKTSKSLGFKCAILAYFPFSTAGIPDNFYVSRGNNDQSLEMI